MDVWIAVSPQNAERMVAALREFGFGTPNLSVGLFLSRDSIVRMGILPMRIEVMNPGARSAPLQDCFAERVADSIDGVAVNLISLSISRSTRRRAAGTRTSTISRTCREAKGR
jgi:hypothetical protein